MAKGTSSAHQRKTLANTGGATSSGDSGPMLALTVAYHPQLDRVGERAYLTGPAGEPTPLSRTEPEFVAAGDSSGEPLNDDYISRKPIYFTVLPDGALRIDMGEGKTAVTIGGRSITKSAMLSAKDIARGVVLGIGKRVVLLLHSIPALDQVLGTGESNIAPELIGSSVGLRRVLLDIRNVADTNKHVLLRGETGSGKELVAQAIHRASSRRDKPLVVVNVAAITESLAASEFFGTAKGSFTGAVTRPGYFEQASGGTLFLDEIGDIPPSIQPTLLRALENGEIQPVGSQQSRKMDVRIISATDANLENKGAFSQALHQRLKGYEIWIPPLRERRDDIGPLLVRFLRDELEAIGESHRLEMKDGEAKPWLSASIVAQLIDFDWPGNIRELKNVIGQLVIGNRGRDHVELTPAISRLLATQTSKTLVQQTEAAPAETSVRPNLPVESEKTTSEASKRRRPADVTEKELREALSESRWDLAAAAEQLGISRAAMYLLPERFPWFRTAGDLSEDEIRQCHRVCNGNLQQMAERLEVSERALRRRVGELGLA